MNPTLIAGFEDVMGFIKSQELRIKNVEQNEKVRELKVQELFLENKKLKEENEKLKEKVKGVVELHNLAVNMANDDNARLQEENEKLKGKNNDLQEFVDELEEEEDEKSKYDGDDWSPGYGFTVKDGEYRICMAGGGDHWFDYVINKNGCFIDNKNEKKKVKTFISCPGGNYLKAVSVGEDYFLDDGESETDMYEMVKECFQEEIMDYEEEDCIPAGSDEECEEE